jgi:hypothetical protein
VTLTLSQVAATDSTNATNADQDHGLISSLFNLFIIQSIVLKNDEWFSPDKEIDLSI